MSDACVPLLECHRIVKRFGGEVALGGVDFTLRVGEVHGLVGCNGAGKTTLMKILAGAIADYEGEIRMSGQRVRFDSPPAALAQGIAMVYQELSGVGALSVAENLFLGRQPTTRLGRIDWRRMRRVAADYLAELDIQIDVTRRLDSYPLAIRQLVEIARGLHSGSRVLIMDEPTSALSPPEVSRLFELIARARARDRSLVFISHFIEDVLAICDRVTILRDGKCVATERSERLEKSSVIRAMLGQESDVTGAEREPGNRLPPARPGDAGLRCAGLTREGAFRDVTLSVAAGETLGIYGFVGAGHSELAHCLAGSLAADTGRIWVDKHELKPGRASQAIRQGVVFVGADRSQTLVPTSEIYKNVTLAHLRRAAGNWLVERRESQLAQGVLQRVGCRPPNPLLKAGALSGGNQQKVVIAKWLLGPARFWILEEPTRGMDVGAKQEILALIEGLKRDGAGVVLASSEPELILEHADRIVVMSRGRVTHEFADCRVDKSTLIHYA